MNKNVNHLEYLLAEVAAEITQEDIIGAQASLMGILVATEILHLRHDGIYRTPLVSDRRSWVGAGRGLGRSGVPLVADRFVIY